MKDVVIVSAARTPIGSFGGALKSVPTRTLGAIAVKGAIERAGIKPEDIDEVVLGCVLQGGLGQNVARQIALDAGIPEEVPAMTLNKVCGSGLRTVSLAAQMIKAGDADIVVAGGAENMSMAGYAVPTARWGARMNNTKMIDMMVNDGLWDAFNDYHMGITAENIAEKWGITREELDEFSVRSQNKAEAAIKAGKFKDEIIPVTVHSRKGDTVYDTDEYPKRDVSLEKLAKLKPSFKEGGMVTAGNASGMNDAASGVILMEEEKAKELGVPVLARIVSTATTGVEPEYMGIGPVSASKKALEKAGLTIEDMDLFEINEAFAAQAVACARELGIDQEKLNVNGSGISLGHPVGATGSRLVITLMYELKRRGQKYGLATLCAGGGMGTAVVIEVL